jgi:hypothetical protein
MVLREASEGAKRMKECKLRATTCCSFEKEHHGMV